VALVRLSWCRRQRRVGAAAGLDHGYPQAKLGAPPIHRGLTHGSNCRNMHRVAFCISSGMWCQRVLTKCRRMEEEMLKRICVPGVPRKTVALATALLTALGPCAAPAFAAPNAETATPIRHLVVVFQENVSFDHYFGTYPNATNPKGEPGFHARRGTPTVNGYTPALLN